MPTIDVFKLQDSPSLRRAPARRSVEQQAVRLALCGRPPAHQQRSD